MRRLIPCLFSCCLATGLTAATNSPPASPTNTPAIPLTNRQAAAATNQVPGNATNQALLLKQEDLEFWRDTMHFGTPAEKSGVLKQIARLQFPEVLELILEGLQEEHDPKLRRQLLQIVYDRREPRALPILVAKLTQQTDMELLAASIDAIGMLKNKEAGTSLLPFLKHEELLVRQSTVRALGMSEAGGVGGILLEMLEDVETDRELSLDLINTLGMLRYEAAYEPLRQIAINTGKTRLERSFAITALGRLKNPAILPDLRKIIQNEVSPDIRHRVLGAIGDLGTKDGHDLIIVAMRDADETVRLAAVKAAAKIDDSRLRSALLYRLRYDNAALVIAEAAQALHALKTPGLMEILIKKFELSTDLKLLGPLLAIFRDAKAVETAPVLRKKRKEMQFSAFKDRIAELLKEWGLPLEDGAAPRANRPADQSKPAGTPSDDKKDEEQPRIFIQ